MNNLVMFFIKAVNRFVELADNVPFALVALLGRIAIAPLFWFSGRTKVDGFTVTDSAIALFRYEYQVPFPYLSAHLAALGEHIFPIMLVLGLGTRFAALGLFVMTIVIQFVYPSAWWNHHALWFAILAYLIAQGGGALSLDHFIKRRWA